MNQLIVIIKHMLGSAHYPFVMFSRKGQQWGGGLAVNLHQQLLAAPHGSPPAAGPDRWWRGCHRAGEKAPLGAGPACTGPGVPAPPASSPPSHHHPPFSAFFSSHTFPQSATRETFSPSRGLRAPLRCSPSPPCLSRASLWQEKPTCNLTSTPSLPTQCLPPHVVACSPSWPFLVAPLPL